MSLTRAQQTAIVGVEAGYNVFVTGPGGVGKSHVIRHIQELNDSVTLVSTTASSAADLQGVTLHSWAGIGLGLESAQRCFSKMSYKKKQFIRNTQTLIIDECSMLTTQVLELVDEVLQMVFQNESVFGGIQVVMVGDFFQLGPIEDKKTKRRGQEPTYAFESPVWEELSLENVILDENMRQEDEEFQSILNGIRTGEIENVDLNPLLEREVSDWRKRKGDFTRLFSHNRDVDSVNDEKLEQLHTPEVLFVAEDAGHEFLVKKSRLKKKLTLKEGALCIFLENQPDLNLYNGTVGTVIGFEDGFPIFKPAGRDEEISVGRSSRKVYQGRETVPVTFNPDRGFYTTEDGEEFRDYEVNDTGFVTRPRVIASRFQIPLMLGWCSTIHKAQGKTLSHVHAELGKCFDYGHHYVALSRASSLEGLTLSPFSSFKTSDKVKAFYERITRPPVTA